MQKVIHHDIYNIISEKKKQNKSPFLGLVRIFENGKLNMDSSPDGWLTNMTIASGRQFAAQKLFNFKTDLSPTLIDFSTSDYVIDSFGIGSGGTSFSSSSDLTFNGPSICDIDLTIPIPINLKSALNSTGYDHVVKKIERISPLIASSSEYGDCSGKYKTIVKCECLVDVKEPYGTFGASHDDIIPLGTEGAVKIDEAVLYATSPTNAVVIPFAKINFAPKYVELDSILTIEWNIIF